MRIRHHASAAAFAVLATAAAVLGTAPVPASAAPAVSIAGKYTATFTVTGHSESGPFTVTTAKTWKFVFHTEIVTGVWSQSGTTFTFKEHKPATCASFTGHQTATGINSKSRPGPFHPCGGGTGTWYAVR
jgi:hypothetical protein